MIIQHNMQAMFANRELGITTYNKAKSQEKLSSGYKINRAADDAAGLTISEGMRRQIRGLDQGTKNAQDGVSMCQIADGALEEVNDMLHRITELSIKSANGTNTAEDRQAIQEEIHQILEEIDRISDSTTFNTQKIFSNKLSDGSNPYILISGCAISNSDNIHVEVNDPGKINHDATYTYSRNITVFSESNSIALEPRTDARVDPSKDWNKLNPISVELNEKGKTTSIDDLWCDNGDRVTAFYLDFSDMSFHSPTFMSMYGQVYSSPGWYAVRITSDHNQGTNTFNNLYNVSDLINVTSGTPKMRFDKYGISTAEAQYQADLFNTINSSPPIPGVYQGTNYIELTHGNTTILDENVWIKKDGNKTDPDYMFRNSDELNDYWGTSYSETPNMGDEIEFQSSAEIGEKAYKKSFWIQSGDSENNGIWLKFRDVNTNALGINDVNVSTLDGARKAIKKTECAGNIVSEIRSEIGAQQNRLEHTIDNQNNIVENTTAAESRIRDADMATEIMRFSKESILQQVGQAMLAQTNQSRQGILSLLQ